jgi:ribonuclease HI
MSLRGPYSIPFRLEANQAFEDPSVPLPIKCMPVGLSPLCEVRDGWCPRALPSPLFSTPSLGLRYEVFTDGSTPREGGGVSGYAAVVFDARDRSAEPVSFGSWFKCSGNNFLAEMCAIVAAVLAVPAQADVCIYTDSQSCIDAVARDDSAEKRRLRAAARPMVTTLRRLIRSRSGQGRLPVAVMT